MDAFASVCRELGGRIEMGPVARCVKEVGDVREVVRYVPAIYEYVAKHGDRNIEFAFVDRKGNVVEIEYDPRYRMYRIRARIRTSGVEAERVKKILETELEQVKKVPQLGVDIVSTSIVEKIDGRVVGSSLAHVAIERSRVTSPSILADLLNRVIEFAANEAKRAEKKLIKLKSLVPL